MHPDTQTGAQKAHRAGEVKECPQLAQAVLDGGSADNQPPSCGQAVKALTQLRLVVLDCVPLHYSRYYWVLTESAKMLVCTSTAQPQ